MAILKNVEVFIYSRSTQNKLSEFDVPDFETTIEDNKIEKYVEATTDEEFGIAVGVKHGFDFRGADGLKILIDIDGGIVERPWFVNRSDARKGYRTEDTNVNQLGKWHKVYFAFGSVSIDENADIDKEKRDEQLSSLGRIVVKVTRARCEQIEPEAWVEDSIETASGLHKKLVLGSISHTFKPSRVTTVAAPPPCTFTAVPIEGIAGQTLKYTFYYRSHMALQQIGCISRSPSPLPISERSPDTMTNQEKVNEIVRLRNENEKLTGKIVDLHGNNAALIGDNEALKQEANESRGAQEKLSALQAVLRSIGSTPTVAASTTSSPIVSVKRDRVKREDGRIQL